MFATISNIWLAFAFTTLITLKSNAQTSEMWKVDKAHTSVNFSINHLFSTVTGKFTTFDGNFLFDPKNLESSKTDFTISVKSVNTNEQERDTHLQSAEFFDEKKFPKINFNSTKIEKKSVNEFLLHGKLTIKDKSKDVVLPMKITGQMENPMVKGTMILGVLVETSVNRTDFGIGTGNWASTMVVGNEVRISIPIELNRMK